MKHHIVLFGIIIIFLSIISFVTTRISVECLFLPLEIRITVYDDNHKVLQGAVLNIYHKWIRTKAFRQPVLNYNNHTSLISDESGIIVCYQPRNDFGGTFWKLFWIIPIKNYPEYQFVISCNNYKSLSLPYYHLQNLKKTNRTLHKKTIYFHGKETEFISVEHEFILKKQPCSK